MNTRVKTMDSMDACVFSGDMLFVDEERAEFKKMLTRWQNALDAHEKGMKMEDVAQPSLAGRWHHGNGVLCSGTLRIARADFDTCPPKEQQDRVFQNICDTMNHAQLLHEHQQGVIELTHPKCPWCNHQLDDDEMSSQTVDLAAAAPNEAKATVECPLCDKEYWVQGGFKPHYTSAYSEEELL